MLPVWSSVLIRWAYTVSVALTSTFPDYELDEKRRPKLAAWLLAAPKPE
jgi:hypothetical protein